MIPPKIHYMHRTGDYEKGSVMDKCITSYQKNNPNYQLILWTDKFINYFMKAEYPDYYHAWHKNTKGWGGRLKKWDTARLCLLYKYGGFYTDNDVTCLRSLDDLRNYSLVARKPIYRLDLKGHYDKIRFWEDGMEELTNFNDTPAHTCNAFFGCEPNNPTIKLLIDKIIERSVIRGQSVCTATGCVLWGKVLENKIEENNLEGVRLLEYYEFMEGAEKLGWIDEDKFKELYVLHKAWEWKKSKPRWKCFPEKRSKEEAVNLNPEKGVI